MPVHNDETLFTLQAFLDGCKINGTGSDGRRAQFSFSALLMSVKIASDCVNFQNASKAGQTVIGNMPSQPETTALGFNSDDSFIGTLKVYPPVDNDDIDFITQKRTR
jgi:hypothetical protein